MAVATNPYCLTSILIALIGAVTYLTSHGQIGGEAAVGFFTGIVGLFGGAAANAHGVRQGSQASSAPPASE
jgi:hypothetical protein